MNIAAYVIMNIAGNGMNLDVYIMDIPAYAIMNISAYIMHI